MRNLKTRILIAELNSGKTTYQPQIKTLFRWKNFLESEAIPDSIVKYKTLEEAKKYIDVVTARYEYWQAQEHMAKVKKITIVKYP